MRFVPYFLCRQIIDKSITDKLTYQEIIENLSFGKDPIYKKKNRVPLKEYYSIIYKAENLGYNILKIYNKKEDILFNYSSVFPPFGLICLNNKNLLLSILSFISLTEDIEHNHFEVYQKSKEQIEIIISPPCEKLKNSIYLPLGNMLIIMELVKYYLPNKNNYNITMNLIGGSQPDYERKITSNLKCEVHLNSCKNSIVINSPDLEQPFEHYNELLFSVKEKSKFKPFLTKITDINKDSELIEKISSIIRKYYINGSNGKCSIDYISSEINIPVWTLQRKLSEMNRTYSEILNNILVELATSYLYERDSSIREVAEFLGFSSQASFTRFFKLMTGITPSTYKTDCRD